jgi:hypothetical protein
MKFVLGRSELFTLIDLVHLDRRALGRNLAYQQSRLALYLLWANLAIAPSPHHEIFLLHLIISTRNVSICAELLRSANYNWGSHLHNTS